MLICNTPPTPSLLLANDGYDNLNINACSHHSRSRCHRLNCHRLNCHRLKVILI